VGGLQRLAAAVASAATEGDAVAPSPASAAAERAGVWNIPRHRPQTPRLALLAERCARRNARTRRNGLPPYT
jgi:hypothetical protein